MVNSTIYVAPEGSVDLWYEDWNENGVFDPGELSWPVVSNEPDSDGDGLLDGRENAWGTSVGNPDSDYDGITDGDEVDALGGPAAGYNPLSWDTDSDGYSDRDEFYSFYGVNYSMEGSGSSYHDWDGDGTSNPQDSHPLAPQLYNDWNYDGYEDHIAYHQDSDGDGHNDNEDSHPYDLSLWCDWNYNNFNDDAEPPSDPDGDGCAGSADSHPMDPNLWNDWNNNGYNDESEPDADGDGRYDYSDSHPSEPSLWCDWNYNNFNDDAEPPPDSDGDGYNDSGDSHPYDPAYWDDWNFNNIGDSLEGDSDGDTVTDYADSHPYDGNLWNDLNANNVNDELEIDTDGDNHYDFADSHPNDPASWNDWNFNNINDELEVDADGDGHYDFEDSHPGDPALWNDLNSNNVNDELEIDSDSDGHYDYADSHPSYAGLWSDWDYDGFEADNDSHPSYSWLWNDWDDDGHQAEVDTHPNDPLLWNDQDGDGHNDAPPPPPPADSDSDSYPDETDTDPFNPYLWEDFNRNGMNDFIEYSWEIDSDGDYYVNGNDSNKTDPALWSDWDHDGLNSEDELASSSDPSHSFSDPNLRDTDGDGIIDGQEKQHGTHPRKTDTDDDNATDYEELTSSLASNPLNPYSITQRYGWGNLYLDGSMWNGQDTDADGIPDLVEMLYSPGLNPNDLSDAYYDLDGDGNSNRAEYLAGTRIDGNTNIFDADLDGITDIKEDLYPLILNKNDDSDATRDADGDGLLNFEEMNVGLSPMDPDSFDQTPGIPGLVFGHWEPALDSQGAEIPGSFTFSPAGVESPDMQWLKSHVHSWWQMPLLKEDADGDGMTDVWEHRYRLNVRKAADAGLDKEPDGLTNIAEFRLGTNPLLANTQEGTPDYGRLHHLTPGQDTVTGVTSPYSPTGGLTSLPPGTFRNFSILDPLNGTTENGGGGPQYNFEYSVVTSRHSDDDNSSWESGMMSMSWVPPGEHVSGSYSSTPEYVPPPVDPVTGVPDCGCIGGQVYCMCTKSTWLEFTESDGTKTYTEIFESDCHCGVPVVQPEEPEEPEEEEWFSENIKIQITRTPAVPVTEPHPDGYQFIIEERSPNSDWAYVDSFFIGINPGETTGAYTTSPAPRGKTRRCRQVVPSSSDPEDGGSGSLSLNDMAGPRYRKVSLNGLPIPDSKPQMQDESGQQPEETFVDAYTLQLRHSVTDVYASVESSLLPLMVRRDYAAACYNNISGLRPDERPDLPFGSGWRSNICSYIRVEDGWKASVSDESGATQNYLLAHGIWNRNYDENADAKTRFDELYEVFSGRFQLRKKFGTVCLYDTVPFMQTIGTDRANGSASFEQFRYARLISVQDRWKNELKYEYANANTLVPSRIYDPKRPDQQILIRQQNGLVTEIRSPDGETTRYHYARLHHVNTGQSLNPLDDQTTANAAVLIGVSHVGAEVSNEVACTGGLIVPSGEPSASSASIYGQLPAAAVRYHYDLTKEESSNPPNPAKNIQQAYFHVELSAIEDELLHKYEFIRSPNLTQRYLTTGKDAGWKIQNGLPMFVKTVKLPDQKEVHFTSDSRMIRVNEETIEVKDSLVTTRVEGPAGKYRYSFSQPVAIRPVGDESMQTASSNYTVYIAFKQMDITTRQDPGLPAGIPQVEKTESFTFNPDASMALSSVTDMSDKTTRFYYTQDEVPADISSQIDWSAMGASAINSTADGQLYDDPIVEVNAMDGFKTYTYTAAHRLLESVTDARGVKTKYDIDAIGRRTKETVSGPFAGGRVTETFYDNYTFMGFATQAVTDGITPDNMPATVVKYTPDANGRIGVQSTGEMPPGGFFQERAREQTVYDSAGRKRSGQDGRGLITNFDYDARGRLVEVIHPDGSSKAMEYDERGNLEKEVNENGVASFHEYDVFNRRTRSILDLNGDGNKDEVSYTEMTLPVAPAVQPSFNGDICTSVTYTDRGQVQTSTDAKGKVTVHQYDNLGRLLQTDDGGFVTTFGYDPARFGGSVFDSSSFKPNSVTDPRGVVTKTVLDDLYRAVEKSVLGITGVTSTVYDTVGNPQSVTDPLNHTTTFVYDVDGKVVETTFPDGAKTTASYTHAGKPWKQTDELNQITQTHYDGAGRPVRVVQPAVDGVPAVSETVYDKAGNAVIARDPLGRISMTEYDNRNRSWKVTAPPVWDSIEGAYTRPTTETEYDDLGQVIVQEDPLKRRSLKFYDPAGRAWKAVNPLGHEVLSTYDASGNVRTVTQKVTNANATLVDQIITNDYDAHNRLTKTKDGEGIINEFAYDKVGNRTLVQDGLKQQTHFTYDELGRLETQTFANGDAWTFAYDAVNKLSQTDAAGVVTEYGYDERSRLESVTAPDLQRTYSYDDAGRILRVTEAGHAESNVAYTYDILGRVKTETSRGVTHTYHYDLAGNRILAELGTGRKIQTVPDALNRPELILETEGSLEAMTSEARTTSYGYDLAGRAVILTTANGQVTENVYDELGRLTNRTLFRRMSDRSDAGVLAEFGWAYNEVGNVTAQHETWPGSAERDPQVRVTAMTYDLASRLKTETVSQGSTGVVQTSYAYDAANNRKSKTVTGGAEPGHWTYRYNQANQLKTWFAHDSSVTKPDKRTALTYDANGNRTGQELADLIADPEGLAHLVAQGISYQAVSPGPDGEDLTVSLNAAESGQDLGVSIVDGKHVVVDLAVEEALPDTLVNQGITYSTVAPHQEGREVSVSLVAEAPLQEASVQTIGDDLVVKLETNGGTQAKATNQGLTYTAATAGPAGNELTVRLEDGEAGQSLSAFVDRNDFVVKLAMDEGLPHTLTNQGITYATKTRHDTEGQAAVTLMDDGPGTEESVEVIEDEIKVHLATNDGAHATYIDQGLTYTAVDAGPGGNSVEVYLQRALIGEELSAAMTGNALVVRLETEGGVKAAWETSAGTYQAVQPGIAAHNIQVKHVTDGPNRPTTVTADGTDITVHLGTTLGDHAQATVYPDLSGGFSISAVNAGPDGNQINLHISTATSANSPLQVTADGNTIYVTLASDYDGQPATRVNELGPMLPTSLVTMTDGFVNNSIIHYGSSITLSGGGENYEISATGESIAPALAQCAEAAALVEITNSTSLPVTVESGYLAGGEEPAVISTVADVLELLQGHEEIADVITVTGVASEELMAPSNWILRGGGEGYEITSTVSSIVDLINSSQDLITASGTGETELAALAKTQLSGGREPQRISTIAQVREFLAEHETVSPLITVTGTGSTDIIQAAFLELDGGGEDYAVITTANDMVELLGGNELVTASGSGETALVPISLTALTGSAPEILSKVEDVVALLSTAPAVTALMSVSLTGSGETVMQAQEPMALGGVTAAGAPSGTTYTWNSENRLSGVTQPDGKSYGYRYDYRMRRVGTRSTVSGSGTDTHTAILFSGGLSAAEYESSTLQTTLSNAAAGLVHYVRGPDMGGGVGGLLYSLRTETGGAKKVRYNLSNGRGDIVAQSDVNAALTWTASYEAYGKRTQETGTNADKQRANSKDEDPTGLLNEGFRYRDIETGIWLSRDPAGFVDGPNLYAYVKQNPWTSWDPEGLSAYSDLEDSAAGDIANGSPVKGYAKATVAAMWNAFSFGNASRMGEVEDATMSGDMSVGQAVVEAGKGTATAVKDAALTYGTGGAVLKLASKYDKAETAIGVVTNIAEGDYAGAAIAVAGEVVPGGKKTSNPGGQTAREISDAPKGGVPHKNSLNYQGETHVYAIRNPDGSINKIGESAQGIRVVDGASKRAEKQVRKLNRKVGPGHTSEIRKSFSTKIDARRYEKNVIERYRRRFGADKLPGNKNNR